MRQLNWSERWSVAQALFLLPIVAVSLRLSGFQKTYRWLEVSRSNDTGTSGKQVNESVDIATRNLPLYRPTCLPRSLVLWHLLRRRGTSAELRIGVRTTGGQFMAHSWVEADGKVINDAPDIAERFVPVDFSRALGKSI